MEASLGPVEERIQADLLRLFLAHWRAALVALGVLTIAAFLVGKPYAPSSAWRIWVLSAGANTLWQAALCRQMELAPSSRERVERWLPRLLINLGINGVLWGACPVLLAGSSTTALTSACLLNAMLLYCITTAPGSRTMNWVAAPPIGALGTFAILVHGSPAIAALGYAALVVAIAAIGLQLNTALVNTLRARYDAEGSAAELRQHQDRLIESERQRTLLLERERLTRDMHDGLGSALLASLVAVERGETRPEQLGVLLHECVDDLRFVISSLEPNGNDLVAVLASSRERLQRNVDAAGMRFEWAMGDLPQLAWIGPSQSLHVLRIVQEAVSNAVRHAGAGRIRFEARALADEIAITVADDGKGFDTAAAGNAGRGLRSLASRAGLLGGRMRVESSNGSGTSVQLRIPISQP